MNQKTIPIRNHKIQTIYHLIDMHSQNDKLSDFVHVYTWYSSKLKLNAKEAAELHLASLMDVWHELENKLPKLTNLEQFKKVQQCSIYFVGEINVIVSYAMNTEIEKFPKNLKRKFSEVKPSF